MCDFLAAKRELREKFGFDNFRCEEQRDAVERVLAGDDVVLLAPTGMGKSLCYMLPAWLCFAEKHQTAIVISPLLSLQENQMAALRDRFNIPAATLNSSSKAQERKEVIAALLRGGVFAVLFVTPETGTGHQFQSLLNDMQRAERVSLIAVDEAHCISEWGHDFRPAYRRLGALFKTGNLCNTPMIGLTATATKAVLADIVASLKLRSNRTSKIQQSFNRPNIFYEVREKDQAGSPSLLELLGLVSRQKTSCGIVYAATRDDCESLDHAVSGTGTRCIVYHAGMAKARRTEAQKQWESGEVQWAIATVAFGMGIDKPNVRYVVHWTLPKSMEGFYQESGRAGRDGKPSISRIYFSAADVDRMAFLVRTTKGDNEDAAERELSSLNAVKQFCVRKGCRRKRLLLYFDDKWSPSANETTKRCCDVCKKPAGRFGGRIQEESDEESNQTVRRPRPVEQSNSSMCGFVSASQLPEYNSTIEHGGKIVSANQWRAQSNSRKSGRDAISKPNLLRSRAGRIRGEGEKSKHRKSESLDPGVSESRFPNDKASSSLTGNDSCPVAESRLPKENKSDATTWLPAKKKTKTGNGSLDAWLNRD